MNCLYFVERYTAFIGQRCDSWNYSWRYEMWLLYVSTGNCICLVSVFSMFICHWVAANDLIFTSFPFWHIFNICLSLFCSLYSYMLKMKYWWNQIYTKDLTMLGNLAFLSLLIHSNRSLFRKTTTFYAHLQTYIAPCKWQICHFDNVLLFQRCRFSRVSKRGIRVCVEGSHFE